MNRCISIARINTDHGKLRPKYRHVQIVGTLAILSLLVSEGCEPGSPFSLSPTASVATAPAAQSQPASYPVYSQPGKIPADSEALADAILDAVNLERQKVSLPPVTLSENLSLVADDYAQRLIMGDFFAHVDPFNGSTVARRATQRGYMFFKVGENLAAGQPDVNAAMKDWMDSPSHRANVLDPDFTQIGIAVRDGGRHGRYWVQEFGRPLGQ